MAMETALLPAPPPALPPTSAAPPPSLPPAALSDRNSELPGNAHSRQIKLVCSFGGRILPRPFDRKLRCVGGVIKLVSISRHVHYEAFLQKLMEIYGDDLAVKYQLPDDDLDTLVSVTSDEDLENMMNECDRLDSLQSASKLRVFVFSMKDVVSLEVNNAAAKCTMSELEYVHAVDAIPVEPIIIKNASQKLPSHRESIQASYGATGFYASEADSNEDSASSSHLTPSFAIQHTGPLESTSIEAADKSSDYNRGAVGDNVCGLESGAATFPSTSSHQDPYSLPQWFPRSHKQLHVETSVSKASGKDHLSEQTEMKTESHKHLHLETSVSKASVKDHLEQTETKIDEQEPDFQKFHSAVDWSLNPAWTAEGSAISRGLQIIHNCNLEELMKLGSGSFGTVYYGKWKGADIAIKRLKSDCFAGKPSVRERLIADFWREICILGRLHHPNIVTFYGVVPDGPGGTMAIATEYMADGSLRQALEKEDRTLDPCKRLLIAMDVAFGMEYLHGEKVVHFDIKSDNLLVNLRDLQRPICKVGDLGLSKVKQQTMISGVGRGTLPWMAPELLNANSSLVSEKVDVYSFGIVLWELLTGEQPYADMHLGQIIGGIMSKTLRPPIPQWCDPAYRSLMERCWSADPLKRPTFSVIAKILREMEAALSVKSQGQAFS